jgi:hypothetical protein
MYADNARNDTAAQGAQLALPLFDFESSGTLRSFVTTAADPQRRGRRQRAVVTFTVMGDQLLDFAGEIDSGAPLTEAIARRFGVRPSAVRRLRRIDADVSTDFNWSAAELLPQIDRTPADWLPRPGELRDFVMAHRRLQELSGAISMSYEPLVKKSGGRWANLASHLNWREPKELERPVNALYADVLLPEVMIRARRDGIRLDDATIATLFAPAPAEIRQVLSTHWFGDKGPRAIYEVIKDWHSAGSARYPLSLPGGERARAVLIWFPSWPPLIPVVETPNGLRLVSLISSADLLAEGLALGHCIGRYAMRCCYSPFHVLSVRTACGFRLTTAMLEIRPDGTLRTAEHRGAANIPPDRRAVQALDWLISEIGARRIPVDFGALETARGARVEAAGGDDAATRRSYRFYSPMIREWVFRAYYAPYLPLACRDMSRDEWLAHTGLAKLARAMTEALIFTPRAA